jgi:hypothetical protein
MCCSRVVPYACGVDEVHRQPRDEAADEAGTSGSTRGWANGVSLVAVVAVVAAAVVVVLSLLASVGDPKEALPRGLPGPATVEPASPGAVVPIPPVGAPYDMTVPGISGFLEAYQTRFGTSRVVDLTLYDDYAVVNVPELSRARQSGWLYRGGRWTGLGGVRAVLPGSRVVDTRRLDVPALVRNIARARSTLNADQPAQTYVIVRFVRGSDRVPRVDIHVANQFKQSGHLATTLDGVVEGPSADSPSGR